MNAEDEKALQETVGALLESPADEVLGLLEEAGWDDLVAEEEASAISILFGEHGRILGAARILDDVMLREVRALDVSLDIAAVGYDLGMGDEFLLTGEPPAQGWVLVLGEGTAVAWDAAALVSSPLDGFDEHLEWVRVRPNGDPRVLAAIEFEVVVAAGRRALAAELIGVADETLRLAIEYTTQRVQYGRQIASFQTVRHRLSDCHSAIDAARALLAAAFEDDGALAAAVAKASASRAAQLTATHAVQIFGAIGSTQEHVLHRYIARAAVLDVPLTGHRELVRAIGAHLIAAGEAPALNEL